MVVDRRLERRIEPPGVYAECPNTWEHGGDEILLFKSLQTQLWNMNL